MKNRLSVNALVIASMLLLPRVFGIGYETGRMAILAGIYAVIVALGAFRAVSERAQRVLEVSAALFILCIAWFESFPAWNHSAEIGLYLVFGTAVLVIALNGGEWRAVRTSAEA